jgi:hypothetical protein
MTVDYNLIMKMLEQMHVPYYKLTLRGQIVGIEFYQPPILKDVWIEYLETVFKGDDLHINYLPADEMISIVIPEEECIIDKTHLN